MSLREIREKLRSGGYNTAGGSVDTHQLAADLLDALLAMFEA